MSEERKYQDGDIVWVKLGNYWWPAEVMGEHRQPEDLVRHLKRKPFCVVKFFQEDAYEYVKSAKQIFPYQCSKKEEFKKKGIALHAAKNKFMEKFPSDVEIAESLTRKTNSTLIINDRPDSIVKAILRQNPSDGFDDFFDRDYLASESNTALRRRDSVTKILNIKTDHKDSSPSAAKRGDSGKKYARFASGSATSSDKGNNSLSANSDGDSTPVYHCSFCGLKSTRQNVMILHRRTHNVGTTNLPPTTPTFAPPKPIPKSPAIRKKMKVKTPPPVVIAEIVSENVSRQTRIKRAATPFPRADERYKSSTSESSSSTTTSRRSRKEKGKSTSPARDQSVSSSASSSSKSVESSNNESTGSRSSDVQTPPKQSKRKKNASELVAKKKLPSTPSDANIEETPIIQVDAEISKTSSIESEVTEVSEKCQTELLNENTEMTSSTPKCKTEEIRKRLLADWSDEDKEDEEASIGKLTTQNQSGENKPDLKVENEELSSKSDDFDVKIVKVSPSTFGFASVCGSNRVRNIPKKDRRDIVMKDFNSEHNAMYSTPKNPPIVTIDNSNSNSSDSVVVVEVVEPRIAETIDLDQIVDNDEKAKVKKETLACATKREPDEGQDIESSTITNAETAKSDTAEDTPKLSCFDFQDEENDGDMLTSIANFKKKYLSPEKGQPANVDSEELKAMSTNSKQQDLQKKDEQLSVEINSLLDQATPSVRDITTIAGQTSSIVDKEEESVRGLPIKERGKRIFKSRNRSRTDDLSLDRNIFSTNSQSDSEKSSSKACEKNETSEAGNDAIVLIVADAPSHCTSNPEHARDLDPHTVAVKLADIVESNHVLDDLTNSDEFEIRSEHTLDENSEVSKPKPLQSENECNEVVKEQVKSISSASVVEYGNEESSSYDSSEAEAEFGSPVSVLGDERALEQSGECPEENNIKLTEGTEARDRQDQDNTSKVRIGVDDAKNGKVSPCLGDPSKTIVIKDVQDASDDRNGNLLSAQHVEMKTDGGNLNEINQMENNTYSKRTEEIVKKVEDLKKVSTTNVASISVPVHSTKDEMAPPSKINSENYLEVSRIIDLPKQAQPDGGESSVVNSNPNNFVRKRRSFIKITPRRDPAEINLQMDPSLAKGHSSPAVPRKQLPSSPLEANRLKASSGAEAPATRCVDALAVNKTSIESNLNVSQGSLKDVITKCQTPSEAANVMGTQSSVSCHENNLKVSELVGEIPVQHLDKIQQVDLVKEVHIKVQLEPNAKPISETDKSHSTTVGGKMEVVKNASSIGHNNGISPLQCKSASQPEVSPSFIEEVQTNVDIKNSVSSHVENNLANNKFHQQTKEISAGEIATKKRIQSDSNPLPLKRKKTTEVATIVERPVVTEKKEMVQERTLESMNRKENVDEIQTASLELEDTQKPVSKQKSTLIQSCADGLSKSAQGSPATSQATSQPKQQLHKLSDSGKGLKRSNSTELFSKEEELHAIQMKLTDSKKQIGTDSRGNKVIIIKSAQPSEMVVQAVSMQPQVTVAETKLCNSAQSGACEVPNSSTNSTDSTSSTTSPTTLATSPSKPKTPAAAVTGGRKQAGNTITIPSPNSVKQQQQKLIDDLGQAKNQHTDEVQLEASSQSKSNNENRGNAGLSSNPVHVHAEAMDEQELSAAAETVHQAGECVSKHVSSATENAGKDVVLQVHQLQQQQRTPITAPHPLHNRKPRKQPQQHRSPQKKSSLSVVPANELNIIAPLQPLLKSDAAADLEDVHPSTSMNQVTPVSTSQVAIKQAINSSNFNEDKPTQMQADELDGTAKILAVPTHPIRGYNETFLLCTLVNNNYKPIDNVPLYLDHDLNQLVPVPLEALDGEPSLVVNQPPPEDGTVQLPPASSAEQVSSAQLMKLNSVKPIQSDSPTQIVCLPTTVDNSVSSSLASIDGHLLAESVVEADNQVAVFIPNENVTDNAIILNIEGQQIILDSATFAHLLANPDANTQLITDDGTEFVLTREVLAALEAQHEAQEVAGLSEEQMQQQFDLVAANGAQLPAEAGNSDILAVALAGTELYSSDMLQIETSQGLQDLIGSDGNIVFQSSALTQAHLTPPITALTSETNALLNQTPIMSTLEKPSLGKLKPGELISSVGTGGAAVLLGTSVASDLPVMRPNLEDSLAVIGVTTQSSTVPASLELPITVTNPAIAPKVTLAGSPQNIITYQPQRPVLPGQEPRIFNDPGS